MRPSPLALLGAAWLLASPALADDPGVPHDAAPVGKGEVVYKEVCRACHMPDAKGATGAATIPALAGDPRLAASAYPVLLVVNGRGAMPGFKDLLTPDQIAEVSTYVRTHFGNHWKTPVTSAEVTEIEAQTGR